MSEIAVGIDLGTTGTSVAANVNGRPEAADNREGNKRTPSVVLVGKDEKRTVGERAANLAVVMALYVVMEVKRMMGLDVTAFTHPDTGKEYSPVEISSFILAEVVSAAEEFYGKKIKKVVITVPAYFDNKGREDTKKAAEMVGLEVLKIINEPTAAMIAYVQAHPNLPNGKYAIIDLGGGTLDVTVVELAACEIQVLNSEGDRRLGGTDATRVIEQLGTDEFRTNGVTFDPNVPEDAAVRQEIREKAEKAKRELTKLAETVLTVSAKGKTISLTVTRQQFENLCKPLTDRIRNVIVNAVKDGSGDVSNLKGIVMVGGASRMPCIQKLVEEITGGKVPILKDISADLAVAFGASYEAARLSGQADYALRVKSVTDVSSFDIGVAAHKLDDPDPNRMYVKVIVPKGTGLPAKSSAKFGMTSMPGATGLEAELIVAEGKPDQVYDEKMKVQSFSLCDLPSSDDPSTPVIEVAVCVDENGIIVAEATHLPTGKKVRQEIGRKAND
jgi:molecular chaperone DnaK